MTKHSSYGRLLLFVYLLFLVSLWLGAEARVLVEKNQLVVGKVGSPTSLKGEGEECKKRGVECKREENDEVQENVFETGNYTYTNSNPWNDSQIMSMLPRVFHYLLGFGIRVALETRFCVPK